MSYSRGDVVSVAFPFSERGGSKWRPALVISVNEHNDGHTWVLLAQISTQIPDTPDRGQYRIKNLRHAGLEQPSIVNPKIFAIDASLIRRKDGELPPQEMRAVSDALRWVMGL